MKKSRNVDPPDGHLAGEAMRKVVRTQIRINEPPRPDRLTAD